MKNQIEVRVSSVRKSASPGKTAFKEREGRRRERGFPGPVFLGRSQKMLRTVTFVERYQG